MTRPGVQPNETDTIVLIHGLWVTTLSWEHWISRYRARGYRVLAPDWPGMDAGIEHLRHDPAVIARLGVTEIADHYDHLIRALHPPPVIMGHCLGGLVVQILIDRGLGAAGVAIDPAPARRVRKLSIPMSVLGLPALYHPARYRRTILLSPRQFHRSFANTLSRSDAAAVRDRYHVPGPGRTVRQFSSWKFAQPAPATIDFGTTQRAPLLLIADGKDRIFPAAVTRSSFLRYRTATAITAYQEFPARSHYTIGEPGWEQVADYALRWAMENALDGT
jgi:alpha-beta hydrolase superfamily lysophospholipase